ncbi:11029_t:CDS:2 [Acaulospora colombiana]|uniref:11029_t:CDS:1 n=1 Tax=Acaulospora colombiana TaxID=27376 RepID=A0ACA9K0R7_9GLOM|nr:11029_t:CDS:2 [Acaulospora colombiana]
MQTCDIFCSAASSELVFRRSYLGPLLTTKESTAVDLKESPLKSVHSRRISSDSMLSNDSGIGFIDADYEIQRAIRAQRVQRPRIIVLHKGRPVCQNHKDNDANLVLKAAMASRRHRREVAVMQQRNTQIFGDEKNDASPFKSNNTIDISPENDNSSGKINILEDNNTSEFGTKSVICEETTRESIILKDDSKKTYSFAESKLDKIPEPKEQTSNSFVPEESINTPRIPSILKS